MGRFKRAFLLVATNYSVVCGLSSVGYDIQRRRIVRRKFIKFIALFNNITSLMFLPFSFYASLHHMDVFDTNPLSMYTNLANVCLRNMVVILICLLRRRCEPRFVQIVEELMELEQKCCDGLGIVSNHRQPRLFRSLGFRVLAMVVQRVFVTSILDKFSATNMQMLLSDFNQASMLNVFSFYFLAVLTWITRLFHLQNERLLQINEVLRSNRRRPRLAVDLEEICAIHDRLARILRCFCDTYKYQILLLLATVFVSNATAGYYFVVAIIENMENFGLKNLLIAFGSNALSLLDIYFFYSICGRTEYVSARTFEILRQFSDLHVTKSPQFERSCEMMCLVLVREKVRVRIHDMFNLNRRSTFLLIAETIMYTIVFVQSDYKNIKRIGL